MELALAIIAWALAIVVVCLAALFLFVVGLVIYFLITGK